MEKIILQLQEEKIQLFEELEQTIREKRGVQASYEEAINQLSESKTTILKLNEDLAETKYELSESVRKLEAFKEVLESKGVNVSDQELLESVDKVVDSTSFSLHKLSLGSESLDTINCKICGEIVEFNNMNLHSKRCSVSSPTKDQDISKWIEDVTREDNYLSVTLTRSNPLSGETAPFKVITKMRLEKNKHKCVDVYRSHGDFYWLHSALQVSCPDRIIPPLQHQISLFETMIEFQRFLNRLSSHTYLKTHSLLYKFLCGSNETIRLARTEYRQSKSELTPRDPRPHSRGEQDTSLADTKNYLMSLEGNLLGLHDHFQEIRKLNYGGAGKWLEAISINEPRDTYTKVIIKDIARIFQSMNNTEGEESIEDWTFIQNLQSTIQYITSAKGLLERIEQKMDKYLFWEEEVQTCENANYQNSSYTPSNHGNTTPVFSSPTDSNEDLSVFDDSGMSESGGSSNTGTGVPYHPPLSHSNSNISQKWAEANSQSTSAREDLEKMCESLAAELVHFDYLKEKELKNILTDFVNTQQELMQKQQSKWYAMRILLESQIERGNRSIQFVYDQED